MIKRNWGVAKKSGCVDGKINITITVPNLAIPICQGNCPGLASCQNTR